MKILVINGCIRGEKSRTQRLLTAFLTALRQKLPSVQIQERQLTNMDLHYLSGAFFEERERLLEQDNRAHERFDLAHEFAQADAIVVAAPFWDLSIPAILKVYIENVSVDGITFASKASGLEGLCKAGQMVFLTTRGGEFADSPLEQGARYLNALCEFFGIGNFTCIAAEGLDAMPWQEEERMEKAIEEAKKQAEAMCSK